MQAHVASDHLTVSPLTIFAEELELVSVGRWH